MNEPTAFRAGDTVTWAENFPDYPASSGWALTYYFGGANSFFVAATASGGGFTITIDAATTTSKPPGWYTYQAVVKKGLEEHTVSEGGLDIKLNLAALNSGMDTRSHVRKVFDQLKAVIESQSTKGYETLQVATPGGSQRSITNMSWDAIIKAYHHYEKLVQDEVNAQRAAAGIAPPRLLTRFDAP